MLCAGESPFTPTDPTHLNRTPPTHPTRPADKTDPTTLPPRAYRSDWPGLSKFRSVRLNRPDSTNSAGHGELDRPERPGWGLGWQSQWLTSPLSGPNGSSRLKSCDPSRESSSKNKPSRPDLCRFEPTPAGLIRLVVSGLRIQLCSSCY